MKTSLILKENRTLVVLEPESDHDKSILDSMEKLPNTHRVDFYDTEGGFSLYRERENTEDLVIVFDTKKVKE